MNVQEFQPPPLEVLERQFGLELYEAYGIFGAKPPTRDELAKIVRQWFAEQEATIRDILRRNERIRELAYGKEPRDRHTIAALLIDALSNQYTNFPVLSAALLIAHYYLDHYIGPIQSDQSPKEPAS